MSPAITRCPPWGKKSENTEDNDGHVGIALRHAQLARLQPEAVLGDQRHAEDNSGYGGQRQQQRFQRKIFKDGVHAAMVKGAGVKNKQVNLTGCGNAYNLPSL